MITDNIHPQHLLESELSASPLYKATVTTLRKQGNLKQVSKDSHISYNWLWKFSSNQLASADVDKVVKLYEHLTGEALI